MRVSSVAPLLSTVFSRYLLTSVIALAVDMGAFLQLLAMGTSPALSSAISYSIGILTHWIISTRAVFETRVAARGPHRHIQLVHFVLSALVGLALTTGIVAAGLFVSLDPRIAKVIAVGVSFFGTWHLRNRYVFKAKPEGDLSCRRV
jgi:putative flippase GtrA